MTRERDGGPPQAEGGLGGLWYAGAKGQLGVHHERQVSWEGRWAVEQAGVKGRVC